MITTNKKISHSFKIFINSQLLEQTNEVKYLGVVLDHKLTWKSHIQYLKGKLASGCWALYQLRKVITNTKTLKQIYYGLIFSHIQYCISSWASAAPTNLTALDSLHNRSLRIILKQNRRSHLNPLYFELKLLKINEANIITYKLLFI